MTLTRTEKALFAVAFVLLGFAVYMQLIAGNVGDKDWLLAAAHLFVTGKKLYVDIIEVNPPLIIWIYAVPVYISRHLGFIQDFHALVLLGFVLIGLTVFVSARLLALHPQFTGNRKKILLHGILLCLVLIFFTSPSCFLDREHIFLILILPYILRFMPSLACARFPAWLRAITGVMAAIGFCIKPHTLVVFAGLQLLYVLRERSFRIVLSLENILIYAGGVLYLGSVWLLTPEYFQTILPMALATYSAWNARSGSITFALMALLTFGITFADFRLRHTSPYRKDIFYFLGVCLFFFCYVLVNNGWGYTYTPLIDMILIITGWVWWEHLYLKHEHEKQGLPVKQFLFGARACAINFTLNATLILGSYVAVFTYDCNDHKGCRSAQQFMEMVRGPEGLRSFGGINFQSYVWCDLIRMKDAKWETRFGVLWMLPKFVISDSEFTRTHQWILDYVGEGFAEDLNQKKPAVMIVDASPSFYTTGKPFDVLKFLNTYPDFREAWKPYHLISSIDHCHPAAEGDRMHQTGCRFDVYERAP